MDWIGFSRRSRKILHFTLQAQRDPSAAEKGVVWKGVFLSKRYSTFQNHYIHNVIKNKYPDGGKLCFSNKGLVGTNFEVQHTHFKDPILRTRVLEPQGNFT